LISVLTDLREETKMKLPTPKVPKIEDILENGSKILGNLKGKAAVLAEQAGLTKPDKTAALEAMLATTQSDELKKDIILNYVESGATLSPDYMQQAAGIYASRGEHGKATEILEDISKRQAAAEKLMDFEQKAKTAVDNLADTIKAKYTEAKESVKTGYDSAKVGAEKAKDCIESKVGKVNEAVDAAKPKLEQWMLMAEIGATQLVDGIKKATGKTIDGYISAGDYVSACVAAKLVKDSRLAETLPLAYKGLEDNKDFAGGIRFAIAMGDYDQVRRFRTLDKMFPKPEQKD